jgi:hypothetical protein
MSTRWAIVHTRDGQTLAGRVSETEVAGARMLLIEGHGLGEQAIPGSEIREILWQHPNPTPDAAPGMSATVEPIDPVADLRRTVAVLREQAQRTGVVAHDLQADGIERALATLGPEIEKSRATLARLMSLCAEGRMYAQTERELQTWKRVEDATLEGKAA